MKPYLAIQKDANNYLFFSRVEDTVTGDWIRAEGLVDGKGQMLVLKPLNAIIEIEELRANGWDKSIEARGE